MSISPCLVEALPSAASLRAWLDDLETLVDTGASTDAADVSDADGLDAVEARE